ncbi:MAG: amidohydrolase family protein [Anaerolineales bacterium]
MIIDSHTHAWLRWPYRPLVPDVDSRGRVEQLLWEMDRHGVDKAVLVCANITHNPDDNEYVAECVARYPERLVQFADVDCKWSPTYHLPGAADRLRQAAGQYQLKGFTHYLKDDTGWFASEEGRAFFEVAAELNLIASLALSPAWQPALRELARQFPSVPFLCHHMAGARVGEEEVLQEILRSAEVPNIYIKLSGFHYVSQTSWDYPQTDTHPIVRALYRNFGPKRLCWGSDYPVVRFNMTYQQALEAFRTHCTFVSDADKELILGRNLERLLADAG